MKLILSYRDTPFILFEIAALCGVEATTARATRSATRIGPATRKPADSDGLRGSGRARQRAI